MMISPVVSVVSMIMRIDYLSVMIVATGNPNARCSPNDSSFVSSYHTYCLDLPAVPDVEEWICPLCEVDQLSANEELYDDSDLEQLEDILFDDTVDTTATDTEV
jgi:hypothetical protein